MELIGQIVEQMGPIKEFWIKNAVPISIISFALTILGILLSIYSVKKKSRKKIKYFIENYSIIDNHKSTVDGLNITYQDKRIASLSRLHFYLWNAGESSISKEDVYDEKPISLHLHIPNPILSFSIVAQADDTCKFTVLKNKYNTLEIRFSGIEKGEGALLELFYTGDLVKLTVDGKMRNDGTIRDYKAPTMKRITIVLIAYMVLITPMFYIAGKTNSDDRSLLVACLIAVILAVPNIFLTRQCRQ